MSKIAVLGSLNVDFTSRVNEFPKVGETIKAKDFNVSAGGKGANQAVASAKLGGEVIMIGKVGNDEYGRYLVNEMSSNNVDTTNVYMKGVTGRTFINVDDKGDNIITYVPGANEQLTVNEIHEIEYLFDEVDYLVLQQEINKDILEYILEKASKKQCKVLLNAAPCQHLSDKYLSLVDILIVNEIELEYLIGKEIKNEINLEYMLDYLLIKGIEQIIVTLGSKGSIFKDQHGAFHVPALSVAAKDTTAAGDAFIGAYVVAKTEGKSDYDSMNFATVVSAITVMGRGAQKSIPNRETYNQFVNKNDINIR